MIVFEYLTNAIFEFSPYVSSPARRGNVVRFVTVNGACESTRHVTRTLFAENSPFLKSRAHVFHEFSPGRSVFTPIKQQPNRSFLTSKTLIFRRGADNVRRHFVSPRASTYDTSAFVFNYLAEGPRRHLTLPNAVFKSY